MQSLRSDGAPSFLRAGFGARRSRGRAAALALGLSLAALHSTAQVTPEPRRIGLREVTRLAAEQNPDVLIARLEIEKSSNDLASVRAERSAQVYGGSGLGATSGIPQSIQGATPSVAQVTLRQPLLDTGRPRRAEGARETMRSGEHAARAVAETAAYRAGVLYLDFEHAAREIERLRSDLDHFRRIEGLSAARVGEGTEIPLALSRAKLDTARAAARLASAEARFSLLEGDLRAVLGLGSGLRLAPEAASDEARSRLASVAARAVPRAAESHPEVAALGAGLLAARHRARAARSERNPRLDIVGQYSLLARFNNYDDFFRRFERHNWQGGVALQVPLFTGRGVAERVARARLEERELALRREAKRRAIELEGQRASALLREAEGLRDLAKLELEYARENVDVLLAQFEEGRIALDELERARVLESSAWGGLVESEYALAKAQLGVVHAAGGVREALAD